jgi:hypothetical protein
MLLTILLILLLTVPTLWALWDDRNGDKHPNHDLVMVTVLTFIVSTFTALINPLTIYWLDLLRGVVLAGAIYVSVFPYAVNYMLIKRGVINTRNKWYNHLSKTAWPDRTGWWQATPWFGRMFFAAVILLAALQCYFCPGKILSYYNCCFCVFTR